MDNLTKNYGITFNGVHSAKDLNLVALSELKEVLGDMNTVIVYPPYSNNSFDFSSISGENTYKPRTFEITFRIKGDTKEYSDMLAYKTYLNEMKMQVQYWLDTPLDKAVLIDDVNPNWHYLARAIKAPEETQEFQKTIYKVQFECYPFKIKNIPEFDDEWDIFNFISDIAQETVFNIKSYSKINVYNVGSKIISPKIKASSTFVIEMNGVKTTVTPSQEEYPFIFLNIGKNEITVTGTGKIEFIWFLERR